MHQLPTTGSSGLLERLSPCIPDDLINALFAPKSGPGRPRSFSAAQLFRVSLLALLTPVHSFNLLLELLPEERSWRWFARLRNRFSVPDVRMLHEFRAGLDLWNLRRVNEHLLRPFLEESSKFPKSLALIDSTDLPAATNAYKKTLRCILRQASSHRRPQPQGWFLAILRWLQKAHVATVGAAAPFGDFAGSPDIVGGPGKSGRFGVFRAERELLRAAFGRDAGHRGRRLGVPGTGNSATSAAEHARGTGDQVSLG